MDRNALIGERVRFYRTARDMSMAQLCDMLEIDITLQQFARYETNLSRWPADLLCQVADALQTDIRILLGLEEQSKKLKGPEWEAEKYKGIILDLPAKSRKAVFNMIDGLAGIV
jgi:transcriptional regulator with XRE-family HTH domain